MGSNSQAQDKRSAALGKLPKIAYCRYHLIGAATPSSLSLCRTGVQRGAKEMKPEKNRATLSAFIPWLWAGNLILIAVVLLAGLLIDGNGRLPGLNEALSTLVAAGLMGTGLLLTTVLACIDRKRLIYAMLVAVLYLIMLLPTLA